MQGNNSNGASIALFYNRQVNTTKNTLYHYHQYEIDCSQIVIIISCFSFFFSSVLFVSFSFLFLFLSVFYFYNINISLVNQCFPQTHSPGSSPLFCYIELSPLYLKQKELSLLHANLRQQAFPCLFNHSFFLLGKTN